MDTTKTTKRSRRPARLPETKVCPSTGSLLYLTWDRAGRAIYVTIPGRD